MLATKIACPRCSRKLKTPQPVGVGKHLRCSRCDTSFTVRPEDMLDPLPTSGPQTPDPDATSAGSIVAETVEKGPVPRPIVACATAIVAEPALDAQPGVGVTETPLLRPRPRVLLPVLIVAGLFLLTGLAVYLTLSLSSSPAAPDRGSAALAANRPYPQEPTSGRPLPPEFPPDEPVSGPPPQPLVTLPPEEKARVDRAIEQGLAYLRNHQHPSGTWSTGHYTVGNAALPGLTLLECGVAPDDPQVQKAAQFVRDAAPKLGTTYELSLAILFLDRLKQPQDEALIRTMALRLLAGQTPAGGWYYTCPTLKAEDERRFLSVLQETRPQRLGELLVPGPDGRKLDWLHPSMESRPLPALRQKPDGSGSDMPLAILPGKSSPDGKPLGVLDRPPVKPGKTEDLLASLPLSLQKLPALHTPQPGTPFPKGDTSDNSNTQFAILGLWAAGRHGVPTERALAALVTRFRCSQGPDGSWNYSYRAGGVVGTPAMTAAGLLGLAVGHGITTPTGKEAADHRTVEDKAIQQGLKALASHIGKPLGKGPGRGKGRGGINLYFLWSLERVAVLYNLPTIDERDWYGWGAELLVDAQQPQGQWHTNGFPGSTAVLDTSLALLFLKRANLAQDLTRKLQVLTRIK